MKHLINSRNIAATALLIIAVAFPGVAQKNTDVYVDKDGIMRWGKTKEEVHAFGVNYTVPFAHAYRTAKRKNISLEKAIDQDVYHFARLGFDLYRVHVWDCEISDTVGNLLDNEHLKLFDYMLKKMKDRGMKFMLTPIAYWPNGYPEPEERTPGFSTKYGKDACLVNEDAIKAQENYLYQFLNHVNSYTGIAYKNDPDIIAFEISNEPHHGEAAEKVTTFISRLRSSMQKTGCRKPIFYNISHGIHLADAYFKAGIQGGTFQWYPTGLGAGQELGGNLLPNVDLYTIPFANNPGFKKIGKLVYEFDAADVGRSYIYPAMARSFREAGMQIATHFAYDPTYMADVNTEYGTHYMNLVYAPQKALSLKIAGEVFHTIPLYKNYGHYPANATFDKFRVSYEQDLAEMLTEEKFFYTNNTTTAPLAPEKLREIAGWGNSSIVKYEGTGAYFLDRVEPGVWRLEVLPDAVWVNDPFGQTSPKKKVAVVNWRTWPIAISLTDLGDDYSIKGLNEGNTISASATGKAFQVSPGTYLLTKKNITTKISAESRWKNISLHEFAAPATSVDKVYILHKPATEFAAGISQTLEATIVSKEPLQAAELSIWGTGWRPEVFPMEHVSGYTYRITLPEKFLKRGMLRYYISAKYQGVYYTGTAATEGKPSDWDFYGEPFIVPMRSADAPVYLFNAATDARGLSRAWLRSSTVVPLDAPGKSELLVNVEKLFTADPENKNGEAVHDYSMRYFFGNAIAA
ncbi:MAG TPA: membrane or secreted protein, partial [Ohtaekwangia sp.]|uniref:membrane or secreted protein n=1 Tax=Ohtaekwangia sp. TaxID=2066019 RepID=UPI002F94E105